MTIARALAAAWAVAALEGCGALPIREPPPALFIDGAFPPPAVAIDPALAFALSDAMRAYLAGPIARAIRVQGPRRGLMIALREDMQLEYESSVTRSAAEAFEARAGNCLSLVIMTGAFARALDIPVQYQSVIGHDTWTRAGGIAFRSGHVNTVLGSRASDQRPGASEKALIIDFLPPAEVAHQTAHVIPEATIVAMYFNNRAAEAMAGGDLASAYWLARAAIDAFPSFLAPYNTLGVVYLRHGDLAPAERSFEHVLEREPENVFALSNLAQALARQGRTVEAEAARRRLAAISPYPPFYFLEQGLAAMAREDYRGAVDLFEEELERMPYNDEVNFALAAATLHLGDVRRARRYLARALENSTTDQKRRLYAGKLEYLKALERR